MTVSDDVVGSPFFALRMTSNTFTIDDAFASDEEDTIRTYGSTADSRMSPFRAKTRPGSGRPLQNALQSPDKGETEGGGISAFGLSLTDIQSIVRVESRHPDSG